MLFRNKNRTFFWGNTAEKLQKEKVRAVSDDGLIGLVLI